MENVRGAKHAFERAHIQKSYFFATNAKEKTLWFMFMRAVVTTLMLAITLIYQIKDSPVIEAPDLLPIYSLISFTYLITIIFTALIDRIKNLFYFVMSQIAYDILFITALIYITGVQEAVFTFLYLFTISFSAVLFFRNGALYTAAFSSIAFSTLMILDPIPNSEKHLLTLFFNNVAFFLVALLSGYLSEQFQEFRLRLKQEQESVKELEDLNTTILNNMKSGLLTTDLKHRIIYFNHAAEKITGVRLESIYKKNVFDIFPELKRYWLKPLSPKQKKEVPQRKNFKFKKPSGEELIFGFSLSTLHDAEGENMGRILIFEDLTKAYEMEQHLQRQDKLAAVGKLAAGIAHEIRNPLASVSGSIEVLSREMEVTHDNKRLMEIVLKETDRLNTLVGEFLEYVRPQDMPQEMFDLNQIIEDTILALSMNKSIGKNFRIDFKPRSKTSFITGNKEKLKQVFWNLFINAHQAMPDGGVVGVTLTLKDEEWVIEVSDPGQGIAENILNKIFDPFFTTKSRGTGLGLSVVHKIIEAHHGRIQVSSEVAKGTTFTIWLPQT